MQTITASILYIVLTAAAAVAGDSFPIKVYLAPRAEKPVKLDGVMDEPCWKKAPLATGFTFYDKQTEQPAVRTLFRVAYDAKYLYFGVICEEPLAGRIVPTRHPRDSIAILPHSVEVFVDPFHDHENYFQLASDPSGSLWDAKQTDSKWISNTRVVVKIEKKRRRWVQEWAIPLKDMGISNPVSGHVMGFNVCRNRHLGGREWTNWSRTHISKGFHDPPHFGHLVLSPTPKQLGSMEQEFRKGGRRGPILICICSKAPGNRHPYVEFVRQALKRFDSKLSNLEEQMKREQNASVRKAISERIKKFRAATAEPRKLIKTGKNLDAGTWSKMNVKIHNLLTQMEMDTAIWDARLDSLLDEI